MVAHVDAEPPMNEKGFMVKYRGVIQEIGPMVDEFLPHGVLIFFGESAPAELREVSLVHNGMHLEEKLAVGDVLEFLPPLANETGESEGKDRQGLRFRVTAVGEMADGNLGELGHLVVHFDAATIPILPGTISVEPVLQEVPLVGTTFQILGLEKHLS